MVTTCIGIEPGHGLIGRFGNTIILIPRDAAVTGDADEAAGELLSLAAAVAADPELPASMIAARLASWVIGRMPDDATAFGIVVSARESSVMFLRGAVWCEVTGPDGTHRLSGEQALTWVDQILPASLERLEMGGTAAKSVQAYPGSDLRGGIVPGQAFVLTRVGGAGEPEPVASQADPGADGPATLAPAAKDAPPAVEHDTMVVSVRPEPPGERVAAHPTVAARSPLGVLTNSPPAGRTKSATHSAR